MEMATGRDYGRTWIELYNRFLPNVIEQAGEGSAAVIGFDQFALGYNANIRHWLPVR